ncbi:MAG: fibronectin type III domain-containing protein, partial [Bacteroidaceae bacterium]|nr:fibronectin type III domain-containing protein [Bacteroidaceae bacterium]
HLSYVHGRKYVVQPLPVKDFSMSLSSDEEFVILRWRPVDDPQEPTAKPGRYVVYTRVGNGAFDNGVVVNEPRCVLPVAKRVLYSFKVAALNDGGESLPSEVLSLFVAKKAKAHVLVVNGFHRLSAPQQVKTPSKVGFEMEVDPGVSYMRTPEYCGPQLDFLRENIGYENGLGLSGNNYEGMLIAGNTFDYPFVHGEALAANGFTFVSCGSEAVMNGDVELSSYDVVDLILGVEKQGGRGSYLGYNRPYKTFPVELQNKLRGYCNNGGRLFVSGAFIASDMSKNVSDRTFIREVLRLDYGGTVADATEDIVFGSGLRIPVWRKVNEQSYAVSRPDILVPIDDAFVSFVFDGNRESAGVAYSGNYRTLSVSFPFEAIADREKRIKLMGAVMRFLLD